VERYRSRRRVDCSGLVQWAYRQINVELSRPTQQQILVGVAVPVEEMRPGDLVFTKSDRGSYALDYGHVAIYAGGGKKSSPPGAARSSPFGQ
jgi:cell wall-associated NlpC family hydrolase